MKTKLFAAAGVLLFNLLAAGPAAGAEAASPDKEGFIRDWLLLSPIQLAADTDGAVAIDQSQIPDEGALKPKAGDKATVAGKEHTWRKVKATDYYLDLNSLATTDTEKAVAYAVCYIHSESERKELQLKMGSNDQGKVYLNGRMMLKATEPRSLDQDSDVARNVTLNKGVNVVVFKIFNEGGSDWQGCLRFTDAKGKAVTDLVIKLEP
jgi:hypothetical protein